MVAVVHVIEERVAGVGAGVRAGREGHDLRQIADGGLAYVAHAVALHVREFIRTGGLHCLTTAERVKTDCMHMDLEEIQYCGIWSCKVHGSKSPSISTKLEKNRAHLDTGPLLGTAAVPQGQLAAALAVQGHCLPTLRSNQTMSHSCINFC